MIENKSCKKIKKERGFLINMKTAVLIEKLKDSLAVRKEKKVQSYSAVS